jgi:hypothetical protein
LSDPLNLEKEVFCDRAPRTIGESAMSEAEYDRLLNAVREAVEPVPQEEFIIQTRTSNATTQAANDNGLAWPPIPFPVGWHAGS